MCAITWTATPPEAAPARPPDACPTCTEKGDGFAVRLSRRQGSVPPAERVESVGIDRPGGTDTHAENVEKPPAEDRPAAPPPDRPGSPGQPSRLESLRAAREAQEARRAETGTQQTAPQETGAEQRDEREKDRGESSSAEPADKEPDAQAGPKLPERGPGGETESDTEAGSGDRDRETDRSGSEIGQARPDGRGEQPYAAATGELTPEQGTEPRGEVRDDKAEPSYDGPADERPDAPAEPQTDEDRPMTGETEPEDPQDRDHQPLPQQDGRVPGDDGNDSRGGAGNEQQPQADDQPAGHDNTPQDEPAPADQQDSGSETQQAAEAPVRASENPEPGTPPSSGSPGYRQRRKASRAGHHPSSSSTNRCPATRSSAVIGMPKVDRGR